MCCCSGVDASHMMGGEQSHDGEKKQDETKEKEESENPDSSRSAASEGNTCFQQSS